MIWKQREPNSVNHSPVVPMPPTTTEIQRKMREKQQLNSETKTEFKLCIQTLMVSIFGEGPHYKKDSIVKQKAGLVRAKVLEKFDVTEEVIDRMMTSLLKTDRKNDNKTVVGYRYVCHQ